MIRQINSRAILTFHLIKIKNFVIFLLYWSRHYKFRDPEIECLFPMIMKNKTSSLIILEDIKLPHAVKNNAEQFIHLIFMEKGALFTRIKSTCQDDFFLPFASHQHFSQATSPQQSLVF